MSRFNILCLCVVISNEVAIPLEELWFDNRLTFLGALILIFYFHAYYIKIIKSYNEFNKKV